MDCIEAQGLINRFIDDKLDEKALTDFLEHVMMTWKQPTRSWPL